MGEEGVRPVSVVVLGGLLLMAACASGSGEGGQAPLPPGYVAPQASTPAPRPAPQPARPADACGASELTWLVGKPKTEIPVPVDPSSRRVVCTTCAVTQEYISRRQTIRFDLDSGIVQSVTCG